MGRRTGGRSKHNQVDDEDAEEESTAQGSGTRKGRRRGGSADDASVPEQGGRRKGCKAVEDEDQEKHVPDFRSMTCVAFKAHTGKHVKAEQTGDLKATSTVVKDSEKFQLIWHDNVNLSLKGCHGKYVSVDKGGDVRANSSELDAGCKFEAVVHQDGLLSLRSVRTGGFVAAEGKGGILRANRGSAGAWEKFVMKDRSQKKPSRVDDNDAENGRQGVSESTDVQPKAALFIDALCQLEAVLLAEENYGRTHTDSTAIHFSKRARVRRQQGLAFSAHHFFEEHGYPESFRACISAWDVTSILLQAEARSVELEAETDTRSRVGSVPDNDCLAWATILDGSSSDAASRGSRPKIHSSFGIPAASAVEAEEASFRRLSTLCRLPSCVALGPVGLDFTQVREESGAALEQHCNLSADGILAEFGTLPTESYDPMRDPECIAWLASGNGLKSETWTLRHGDRRLNEFKRTCAHYARRRLEVQTSVVERQIRLAVDLGLPIIIQLPPQDEAERKMVEVLTSVLGEGSTHPILLSAFHGRPKCAAALLKHLPGLFVGFSGLLTHSKLKGTLGEIAFDTPLERLVLESLGPRWPPAREGSASARGSYSHPLHVVDVAKELAKIKKTDVEVILDVAWKNTLRLYCLPYPEHTCGTVRQDAPEGSTICHNTFESNSAKKANAHGGVQ
mmetsp:Transcript_50431/g.141110  ORF Transcript_50431/g.141110 Transcript_50431/m.141110 type:complete len:677 (-) Transcript_50431:59-2089(-)